jgi:hypothetical protein
MFSDFHHFVALKAQMTTLMSDDGQHHFDGYTRADGEQFDGGYTTHTLTHMCSRIHAYH